MILNADITIFNKLLDPETRRELMIPTVIRGVSLFNRRSSSAGSEEQSAKPTATIRIPIDADTSGKQYVDEVEYRALGAVSGAWTVQLGDIVVPYATERGAVTETDLKRIYSDVFAVSEFTDNTTRGSRGMRHWRIGGV